MRLTNRLKFLIPLLFLFISLDGFSTNPQIDSLKQVFQKSDSKIQVLRKIENIMQEAAGSLDEEVFDYLFDLGMEYSVELKSDTTIANLYFERGTNYLVKGEYDNAKHDYLLALEHYSNVPAKDYSEQIRYSEAYVYSNLGIINKVQGSPYLALKNYFSAVEVFEELNDTIRTASIDLNIANLYEQHDEFASAIKYFKKAKAYFEAIHYKKGIATAKINYSAALVKDNKLSEGKSELISAIKICRETNNEYTEAYALNQISDLYIKTEQLDSAKLNVDKALKIYNQLGDSAGIAGAFFNYGSYYKALGNYPKSEKEFLKSLEIAQRQQMVSFIEDIAKELSVLYTKQNDYRKAYEQLNIYDSLNTISNSAALKRQLSEIEMLYEKNVFKKQLKESQKEIDILTKKLKNNRLVSGFLILIIIILIMLLLLGRKKKNTSV